jgi:hypothetical protein
MMSKMIDDISGDMKLEPVLQWRLLTLSRKLFGTFDSSSQFPHGDDGGDWFRDTCCDWQKIGTR